MGFLDTFDRVRIINLRSRPDRREEMTRVLAANGLPLTQERVEFYDAERPTELGDWPSMGVRGCFESHYTILKRAATEGWRNVLIFEDDLDINEAWLRDAESIQNTLRDTEWDFAYFSYTFHDEPHKSGEGTGPTRFVNPSSAVRDGSFYAVNGRALKPVVEYLELVASRPVGHPEGGKMPVDASFSHFARRPGVKVLIAHPRLGQQRSSRSDITPSRLDRLPGFVRPAVQVLRSLKRAVLR